MTEASEVVTPVVETVTETVATVESAVTPVLETVTETLGTLVTPVLETVTETRTAVETVAENRLRAGARSRPPGCRP